MQREKMYNLIVHGHSDFWQNDQDYVDFPQERFLEYTSDAFIEKFNWDNQNAKK